MLQHCSRKRPCATASGEWSLCCCHACGVLQYPPGACCVFFVRVSMWGGGSAAQVAFWAVLAVLLRLGLYRPQQRQLLGAMQAAVMPYVFCAGGIVYY